jgi:hypothetical protein
MLRDRQVVTNKLYNVLFSPSHLWSGSVQSNAANFTDYLESRFRNENPAKPAYVQELHISPLKELQVRLSEVYATQPISTSDVDDLIQQKENKIADYQKNSGIENQWLLIIQEGASAESSFDITPDMMPKRNFAFDKIILFDTFKGIAIGTLAGPDA